MKQALSIKLAANLIALALGATSLASLAADAGQGGGQGGESRPIDATVNRVVLNGIASLELHYGPTAALVVHAKPGEGRQVVTEQHGDTLEISTEGYMHSAHVSIDLTLPALREFFSNGTGAAQLSGFSGDQLILNSTGTGKIDLSAHYKHLVARSSGVAGMTIDDGDSDSVELSLPGAGHVMLSGQTKSFTGRLDGVGSVDAASLRADTVNAYLNGVGSVKVYAKQTANIYLHGVGSATVYGNPATRNAQVSGFGKINWE
ncbi:MAG: DUF2807 domain-containing protein [Burkholderiaceae bacterium]|nr:DUF2807 domain-containing protein [Burkholderiaceae bacterium]